MNKRSTIGTPARPSGPPGREKRYCCVFATQAFGLVALSTSVAVRIAFPPAAAAPAPGLHPGLANGLPMGGLMAGYALLQAPADMATLMAVRAKLGYLMGKGLTGTAEANMLPAKKGGGINFFG